MNVYHPSPATFGSSLPPSARQGPVQQSHNIRVNLSIGLGQQQHHHNKSIAESSGKSLGKQSRGGGLKDHHSSIWDNNEDATSSRKRIVMPL
jgi:hypothetical protein